MLNNIVIGRYIDNSSKIHKMNSILKLISLISFILIVMVVENIMSFIILTLLLLYLIYLSNLELKIYMRPLYSIKYLIISLAILGFIGGNNLYEVCVSIIQASLIITYSSLISLTTKIDDLTLALESILYPLKYFKINLKRFSFIIATSIRFIPIIIDTTNAYLKAQYDHFAINNTVLEKYNNFKNIIIPIIAKIYFDIERFSILIDIRGYDLYTNKIKKHEFNLFDFKMLLMHCVIFIIVGGLKWSI